MPFLLQENNNADKRVSLEEVLPSEDLLKRGGN